VTKLQVGDQVRMRRRGGAVPVIYQVVFIDEDFSTGHSRLIFLESPAGKHRTALESDVIVVTPAQPAQ
jgi:hypothetical protein